MRVPLWLLSLQIFGIPGAWAVDSLQLQSQSPQPPQTTLEPDDFSCPDYASYASRRHDPPSTGAYRLPYQRPVPACRTFNLSEVEETIAAMERVVKDPDLFRLFENCFPNTLDTAIAWKGITSNGTGEELTFITTGDINAMWLRDSANQLQSYKSLLRANGSSSSLASLFRGTINLQARYVQASPHCNAFQAPAEANLTAAFGLGSGADYVWPTPDATAVFECKYELDSLAAFLQLSHEYYVGTGDAAFFGGAGAGAGAEAEDVVGGWSDALDAVLNTTAELLAGTYGDDGSVAASPYTFQRSTSTATETLCNGGVGAPVRGGTGLVRSAFRPSDDACTYQLFIPGNMMLSRYLTLCADIVDTLGETEKAGMMRVFADSIRAGIEKYGRVNHRLFGKIYAYEVDGYGSYNVMDDANIPSLLSAPMFGYVSRHDPVYQNTRRFILSKENPYFMSGPVINSFVPPQIHPKLPKPQRCTTLHEQTDTQANTGYSTGGPHAGPGMAWPMSLIVRILTSDDDDEIVDSLRQILSSTDGLGLIHESINTQSESVWTRQW
ncbi:Six-hairpin glycosidase-like protein [Lasiosphaeria ovina]|uniref:Six-hairpin glycosidase-like protein n=1 Tax=Lasiosphaeria ovina TaxID=92902 RepID=A0AAE0NMG4_9PEZI|nr:Six-hairpin glycosidase-like protein [Lasiosphaeria ovina]